MIPQDDTIQLINFEAKPAPEDSEATIELMWQVKNALQVTIEGPGIDSAGLNRRTFYSGTGQLHINTTETKASYKLTAAPDPQRTIHGQSEIDLDNPIVVNQAGAAGGNQPAEEVIDPDATAVTTLGLKGIEAKRNIAYVDYNSKHTLEWAYQNGDEANFTVKGDIPKAPEGSATAKGEAKVGPFSGEKGGSIELLITKPSRDTKTLEIRISRARIKVTNAEVKAGEQATLSWEVESATAVEILPFKGPKVALPTNPDFSGSMSFEATAGHEYQFKVEATSSDGRKSHKIMTATVVD